MKLSSILSLTCCTAALLATGPVLAQQASGTTVADANTPGKIESVTVTAERRKESLQSVPVAVTAFNATELRDDHIQNVKDLDSLAPGLTVSVNAGGMNSLVAQLRGENSTADTPGQSGGVAVYIDDVYYGLATGTIFDLADISDMEVLRGPQGTLFGRNANGGAILIKTHMPTGEFGIEEQTTGGNYDQFRTKTRVDLPAFGPFTATFSLMHESRNGDMTNLGAGTAWNWGPATDNHWGIRISPKYLGDQETDAISGTIDFSPNSALDIVERFDYANINKSDPGQGILGNPNDPADALGGFAGYQGIYEGLLGGFGFGIAEPETPISSKRPKAVNNWFVGMAREVVYGDSVTANYTLNDMIGFKDILSYRGDHTVDTSDIFSMGGITLGGYPFIPTAASGSYNKEDQISEEAQINVTADAFVLTAGYYLYYNRLGDGPVSGAANGVGGPSISGGQVFSTTTPPYQQVPVGAVRSLADSFSQAIYGQGTYHVTSKVDVTGGVRQTWDHIYGDDAINYPTTPIYPLSFVHGKLTWLADIDYKATDTLFFYAKASTGYVAGGSLGGVSYGPESVLSYEVGGKADFFDHTLRTDLAVFDAKYSGLQQIEALAPTFVTIIANIADADDRGVELETTWLPPFVEGLQLSAGFSYSDFEFVYIDPVFLAVNGTDAKHTLVPNRPKATFNPAIQYEIDGMPWGGGLFAKVEGKFRSGENLNYDWYSYSLGNNSMRSLEKSDPQMIVDARVAATDISIGGVNAEVAFWGKNLTDDRNAESAIYLGNAANPGFTSANYEPARTYGVDIDFKY